MTKADRVRLAAILAMEREGVLSSGEVFAVLVDPRGWSPAAQGPPRHARGRSRHVRLGRLVGARRGAQR